MMYKLIYKSTNKLTLMYKSYSKSGKMVVKSIVALVESPSLDPNCKLMNEPLCDRTQIKQKRDF